MYNSSNSSDSDKRVVEYYHRRSSQITNKVKKLFAVVELLKLSKYDINFDRIPLSVLYCLLYFDWYSSAIVRQYVKWYGNVTVLMKINHDSWILEVIWINEILYESK